MNIQAARVCAGKVSALRPLAAAARSHRKSPENAICSHPIGEVCDRLSGIPKMFDRFSHVAGVPVDDRGDDEVEAGSPVLLGRVASVDDPPLTESVDRLGQHVPLLAVVQPGMATLAKLRVGGRPRPAAIGAASVSLSK